MVNSFLQVHWSKINSIILIRIYQVHHRTTLRGVKNTHGPNRSRACCINYIYAIEDDLDEIWLLLLYHY